MSRCSVYNATGSGAAGAAGLAMTGYNVLALLVAACTLVLLGVSLMRVSRRPRYGMDDGATPGGTAVEKGEGAADTGRRG